MSEEQPSSTRQLIQAMVRAVTVIKTCSEEPVRGLASDLQDVRLEAEVTMKKPTEGEAEVSKLDLKIPLLDEEARHAGDRQKLLDAKIEERLSIKKNLESKESTLKEKSYVNSHVEVKQGAFQAVICRGGGAVHDCSKCICICYTSLMRVQASRYGERLYPVLCDAGGGTENTLACPKCALRRMDNHFILGTRTAMRSVGVKPIRRKVVTAVTLLLLSLP